MASRQSFNILRAVVRAQQVAGSRGYAVAVAPAASSARAPVRTFRRAIPAAAAKAKVVEPVVQLEAVEETIDEFPMPVAEAVPDYSAIAPPIGSVARPTAGAIQGIEGEASVGTEQDWSSSFKGLSEKPFSKETAQILLSPLNPEDIEIKPDGLLYLPEIKYRRVLNMAFGPGAWGMAPRGETSVGPRLVSREWGLVCLGRLVSIARGEQEYFDPSGVPTATEACKSNALMRCCKDLGIASELWDPAFIRAFKNKHCVEAFVEHQMTKKKRKLWRKKDAKFEYPYKEA